MHCWLGQPGSARKMRRLWGAGHAGVLPPRRAPAESATRARTSAAPLRRQVSPFAALARQSSTSADPGAPPPAASCALHSPIPTSPHPSFHCTPTRACQSSTSRGSGTCPPKKSSPWSAWMLACEGERREAGWAQEHEQRLGSARARASGAHNSLPAWAQASQGSAGAYGLAPGATHVPFVPFLKQGPGQGGGGMPRHPPPVAPPRPCQDAACTL